MTLSYKIKAYLVVGLRFYKYNVVSCAKNALNIYGVILKGMKSLFEIRVLENFSVNFLFNYTIILP